MRKQPDFPATRFLCEVIRMNQGQTTREAIRKAWAAGKYDGVCPKWAAWVMGGSN